MSPRRPAALVLALATWAATAAHVTDKLAVGLYDSAGDDEPRRVLTSGTPVEVLDRGGRLCRVQLGDGGKGWLECRYLTDEKPARVMLVEAQARTGRLWQELTALKETLAQREQHIGELESRLQATERLLAAGERPVKAAAGTENAGSTPIAPDTAPAAADWTAPWLSAAAGVVGGLATGAWLMRRRIRKRFGGLHV